MSLIYSMLMSVDGYVEDEHGRFDWAAPDEEVHSYINQLESSVGTYLYGRRMYETMIYWETAHSVPDQPQFVLDWARQWQATEKIVYLQDPRRAAQQANADRARVRSRRSAAAQGRRPPRLHREWARARRACVKGWSS
jgi:dihydrofolate reductase